LAIEDITARKKVEDLLTDSELRFRRLFETADDGILLLEKSELKIRFANPAITAMLDYSNEEFIGRGFEDIGFADNFGDFQEIMQTLNRDGIVHYTDTPIQKKTGEVVDTDIYMVDKANLVQCNIRSITDCKRAGEALRDSEMRYKELFQFSPDPIIIHDMDMNVIDANDKAVKEFGYSKEELLEKTIFELHPETELKHSAQVLAVMKKEDMLNVETKFVRKDGSVFLAEATPCRYTLGSKPIIHVAIRDITERKQAEEERDKLQSQLFNALEMPALNSLRRAGLSQGF